MRAFRPSRHPIAAGALSLAAVAALATSSASAARPHVPAVTYTLTIGTSMPLTSAFKILSDGVDKSVQLAVLQANRKHLIPNVVFKARPLDDAVGNTYSPDKDAANARTLIADSSVIGVVGPLNSGATEASMPIYNNAGLVNISPSATLVLLTDPANLGTLQPATAAGKGPRTFFRTITSDAVEGQADARLARQTLHARTVYVTDNKDAYGTGVADQFAAFARKLGLDVVGHSELEPNQPQMGASALAQVIKNTSGGNVDLVYFGGEFGPQGGAEFLLSALRHAGLRRTLFLGPVGIFDPTFIKSATPAIANGAYATSVGYPPNVKAPVSAIATRYADAFHAQYPGVSISDYNTEAYDAANIIIAATARAIKSGQMHPGATSQAAIKANREAVAGLVGTTRDFSGVTGTISFDKNGDTTVHPVISVYRVVNGAWSFIGYAPGYAPRH